MAALVPLLRQHRLLEAAQLKEVEQNLAIRFPDAKALARELIQRSWLTAYQVNQLSRGQGAGLHLGNYVVLERLGEGGMGRRLRLVPRELGHEGAPRWPEEAECLGPV